MNNLDVLNRITALFATMADTDEEITADNELVEDLGISSMDVLFLISSLEEEFNIKISQKLVRTMVTIGDVVDAVNDLMENK